MKTGNCINKRYVVYQLLDALYDGDYFFSTGDINEDFSIVTNAINTQGFWAGVSHRYYFDNDFNLVKIEDRF